MPTDFSILFVCNGDNARAPLAAACTKALTARNTLGVTWAVASAGTEIDHPTFENHGEPSAVREEVLKAAGHLDIDLSAHRPRSLEADDCATPDLILAMSWDQVSAIWSLVPGAWERVFTIKEFIHWAKRAPSRPPILFADRAEAMRDKVMQSHQIRKRARADHGFWGGIRPQDLNLIEPNGKGDEAWNTLALAVRDLSSDVVTLLLGPEPKVAVKKPAPKAARHGANGKSTSKASPKTADKKPPVKAATKGRAKARTRVQAKTPR